jgi:hypothetical protein
VRRERADAPVGCEPAAALEALHGAPRVPSEEAVDGAGVVSDHAEHALEDDDVPAVVALADASPAEDGGISGRYQQQSNKGDQDESAR